MMSSTRGSQKWEHGNISRASNGNDNNRERRIDATRYQLSAGRGRETTRSGPGRVGPSKRQLSQFWRRGTLHTGLCSRVSQSVFSGLLAKPWTLNLLQWCRVRVHMQLSTWSLECHDLWATTGAWDPEVSCSIEGAVSAVPGLGGILCEPESWCLGERTGVRGMRG